MCVSISTYVTTPRKGQGTDTADAYTSNSTKLDHHLPRSGLLSRGNHPIRSGLTARERCLHLGRVLGRRLKGRPNHWLADHVPEHVAQRNDPHELTLCWASPAFHHHEPVHSPLPQERKELAERVILCAGDHSRKVERALGERGLDCVVQGCVGS